MWFTVGAKMGTVESESALEILSARLPEAQRQLATAQANTWMAEHPDAMQQKPGHFEYQDWTLVERGPQPSRPPSTPEERAYAIRLTQKLETDPLSLDGSAARAWLDQWWYEIPDITVRPCNLIDPPNHEPNPHGDELYKQITYSEGAFILEHPGKATDWDAAFFAGLRGALRAYESIERKTPSVRSSFLEDLVAQRESGRLPGTVRTLVRERCK
jgi:hypothetical protein